MFYSKSLCSPLFYHLLMQKFIVAILYLRSITSLDKYFIFAPTDLQMLKTFSALQSFPISTHLTSDKQEVLLFWLLTLFHGFSCFLWEDWPPIRRSLILGH